MSSSFALSLPLIPLLTFEKKVKANITPLPIKLENIEEDLRVTIIENSEQAIHLIGKVQIFIRSQPARIHQLFISIIKKFPISNLILQHMEVHIKTTDEQIQYMNNMITHLQKVSPYLDKNIVIMQKRVNFIKQMHACFAKKIDDLNASSSEKIDQAERFKTILINSHYIINLIPVFNALNEVSKTFL